MSISDDVEERLRRAAMLDEAVVERVRQAALASPSRRLPVGRITAVGVAVAAAAVATLAVWWPRAPGSVNEPAFAVHVSGDVASLQTADGTAWIFSAAAPEDTLPPGTSVVFGEGGAR